MKQPKIAGGSGCRSPRLVDLQIVTFNRLFFSFQIRFEPPFSSVQRLRFYAGERPPYLINSEGGNYFVYNMQCTPYLSAIAYWDCFA